MKLSNKRLRIVSFPRPSFLLPLHQTKARTPLIMKRTSAAAGDTQTSTSEGYKTLHPWRWFERVEVRGMEEGRLTIRRLLFDSMIMALWSYRSCSSLVVQGLKHLRGPWVSRSSFYNMVMSIWIDAISLFMLLFVLTQTKSIKNFDSTLIKVFAGRYIMKLQARIQARGMLSLNSFGHSSIGIKSMMIKVKRSWFLS